MTMQAAFGGMAFPPPPGITGTPSRLTTTLIDAAIEKAGLVCHAPKTGNIAKILWATVLVTTGATVDVRLETVSLTNGNPTGTLFGTNTNGAQVVAASDDNVIFTTTLTAVAAVVAGDLLGVVIANPAVSFGNMQIASCSMNGDLAFPYGLLFTASWAKFGTSGPVMIGFEYDDGSHVPIPGVYPASSAVVLTTFNTGSTPDAVGLRFQLPLSVRVSGCWVAVRPTGDFIVRLVTTAYNQGAGTGILASTPTVDKDANRDSATGLIALLPFTASVTLDPNTNYRLIVEPTTATSLDIYSITVGALNQLDGFPGGQNFHRTTAKDPTADGDWTNDNSAAFRHPLMGLMIDGVDDASGAVPTETAYAFVR